MTRILLLSTAIVAGLALTQNASAFGGPGAPTDRPAFAQIDGNGDGQLTAQELQAFGGLRAVTRFDDADANGDGVVTRAELTAAATAVDATRAARRVDTMMARLDTDGNGVLSRDEVQAAAATRTRSDAPGARFLQRADADRNGTISEAEYTAALDWMSQAGGRAGGGNGRAAPFWRK